MKLPRRRSAPGFEFNMTPMIDVVFQLNIFFLVASYYLSLEPAVPVELPRASMGSEEEPNSARLVVTVDRKGDWSVDGEPIGHAQFSQRLAALQQNREPHSVELRLRTDGRVEYSHVEPLLWSAAKLGVTRIRFAVRPDE